MRLKLPISKLLKTLLATIFISSFIYISLSNTVWADEDMDNVKTEIEELEAKLEEIQGQKQTLSQTINYLTTRIQLTSAEVTQTQWEINALEEEIETLLGRIGLLDVNLEKISEVLISRVEASYKNNKKESIFLLLITNGFQDFFRKYKYLKVSQQHDREVIFALEEARTNYDQQKQIKEEKQAEVVALQNKLLDQKAALDGQKEQKQAALRVTRNDEKRFQDQLAKALAELSAIQSIIAGKANETEVGPVNEGDKIASVIPSSSSCSTGAHLHFEVVQGGSRLNPASYLSHKDVVWDNDPDGPFSFTGASRWPIPDTVRITQGYGMTFYASTMRFYGGSPHTGLDMVNSANYTVSAVKNGTLYRGGVSCGGGTLRYVHVEHDGGLDTYYLHVNY